MLNIFKINIQTAILTLCCIMFIYSPTTAAAASKEEQLKAAFLYQFTRYTIWPDNNLTELNICTLDENSLGDALDKFSNKQVDGKRITIRRLSDGVMHTDCQLLYINKVSRTQQTEWISKVKQTGILTVGEGEVFIQDGGIISLVRRGTKQKFQVNPSLAEQVNIKFKSQLLQIGMIVEP